MRLLLDHGADPDVWDNHSSAPLHDSSWWKRGTFKPTWGSVEGTRLLLEYGADVHAEDRV